VAVPSTQKRGLNPAVLERPVTALPGVGKVVAAKLATVGVETVGRLLLYLPFRHETEAHLTSIQDLPAGRPATLQAHVLSCGVRMGRRRNLSILEALLGDGTGTVVAVWYNQQYLENAFGAQPEILVRGVLSARPGAPRFMVQSCEILGVRGEAGLHTVGLVPVYPASADLSVRTIRTAVARAAGEAAHLIDPCPPRLLAARGYPSRSQAVLCCHFPRTPDEARRARDSLAFRELLLLQLALLQRRRRQQRVQATALAQPGALSSALPATLPYAPTAAQSRVMAEIETDLRRDVPMLRLLQGDVGSGKTLVALYCLLRAVEDGGQAALMAPTEVLAEQHLLRLQEMVSPLGVSPVLLRGGQTQSERRRVLDALRSGEARLVVGTHALIQDKVNLPDLRVAVIDEQHRFGVRQREALAAGRRGLRPHLLHMTATPIPRTLSLTLYGDLDVSILDEMPPGRLPVATSLVTPPRRAAAWAAVRRRLEKGEQAYVVCPLVEESEALGEAAATAMYDELGAGELRGYSLGLLHGSLPPATKQQVMKEFAEARLQVLVTTTVIEVGVDVAGATCMVILGARRFGLSQLHQLRGRVGRSRLPSLCLLFTDDDPGEAQDRLAVFARTSDGFELAEADMRLRGEGQLFGERQSGLGDLRVARLLQDQRLLLEAREEARGIVSRDAALRQPEHYFLKQAMMEQFGAVAHWLDKV